MRDELCKWCTRCGAARGDAADGQLCGPCVELYRKDTNYKQAIDRLVAAMVEISDREHPIFALLPFLPIDGGSTMRRENAVSIPSPGRHCGVCGVGVGVVVFGEGCHTWHRVDTRWVLARVRCEGCA